MKLLTKEIMNKLPKLYATESQNVSPVVVKFFTPWTKWTWYALEGQQDLESGDWTFFGLVQGDETELGYFSLSELESIDGPYGLKIERDMYFDNYVVDKSNNSVRRAGRHLRLRVR